MEKFTRSSKHLHAFFLLVCVALFSAKSTAPTLHLVHKKKYVMGTLFEVAVYSPSVERATEAIEKALEEVVRLDGVLSNFKSSSELSQLNHFAHFHAQTVSLDLYRAIEESLHYSRLSGGEFDISVAPLVDAWKAAMNGGPIPSSEKEKEIRSCVGFEKIEMLPPDRIEFHSGCLRIDLGAIGKGYAVDRMVEILRARGVQRALINAGGSTWYALGAPPGKTSWLVHLRDPSGRIDPSTALSENSVSTSEQTPPSLLAAVIPGHIIDPATGEPLKAAYAVSVVARTATASDALSTTLLLLGPERGKALVKGIPIVSAIWVSPDGQIEQVSNGPRILLNNGS